MTPPALPLGALRIQKLTEQIADLHAAVEKLRGELPRVNDAELRPRLLAFARATDEVLALHGTEPGPDVADKLNQLLSGVRELEIPARDRELGPTPTLERLEQATGLIALRLIKALDSAAAMGWLPSKSQLPEKFTAKVARDEVGVDLLMRLRERLDVVAASLDDLLKTSGTESPKGRGLVNFYAGSLRVEIDLARMQLTVGETSIDFVGLWRVSETIAELTGDFVTTIRAWADRVSVPMRKAAETMRNQVRRVVSGIRTTISWVTRKRRRGEEGGLAAASQTTISPPEETSDSAVVSGVGAGGNRERARLPCVLILDTSGSMAGKRIAELNSGLQAFADELRSDPISARSVEIAIVTFGGDETVQPFVAAASFHPPKLEAAGDTPMGKAIRTAVELVTERKATYRANEINYHRPLLFMISDGAPTDDIRVARNVIQEGEASKALTFFAIGLDETDMTVLAQIAVRTPLHLRSISFKAFFSWMSSTVGSVSRSQLGQSISIPAPQWQAENEQGVTAQISEHILNDEISHNSIALYTARKFPNMPVSTTWTNRLLQDIDRDRYKSIRDIDREVDYAFPYVQRYASERPEFFEYGTDWITKSLIFSDKKFREKHSVSAPTMEAAIKAGISR
jgi:uncharacterized protein YegL